MADRWCRLLSTAAFAAIFLWAAWNDPTKAEWKNGPYGAPPDFLLFMLWVLVDNRREQILEWKRWSVEHVEVQRIVNGFRGVTRSVFWLSRAR